MQVYRKKWVIHIERITREKVNGANNDIMLYCCCCNLYCTCIPHPALRCALNSLPHVILRSLMRLCSPSACRTPTLSGPLLGVGSSNVL